MRPELKEVEVVRSSKCRFAALILVFGGALSLCAPAARADPSPIAGAAQIRVLPNSGPGGTDVRVRGAGFGQLCHIVDIYFTDAITATTKLGARLVASDGTFQATVA